MDRGGLIMKKSFTTPFRQYLFKDREGFYHVRLGPKIYMAKLTLDFTPDFDKEHFGGKTAQKFNWYNVLVKDTKESEPRQITTDELSQAWFKRELKAAVNYQRTIERKASRQTPRYSPEQRIAYKNSRF